jgi:transposase
MIKSSEIAAGVIQEVIAGELSRTVAAERLEVSVRTVYNYLNRYSEHGSEGLADHRCGHYHKISPGEQRQIVSYKIQRPQRSIRWIRDRLKLNVSVEAVRQVLIKHQFTQLWRPLNSSPSLGVMPGNVGEDHDRPKIREFQKSLDTGRRVS